MAHREKERKTLFLISFANENRRPKTTTKYKENGEEDSGNATDTEPKMKIVMKWRADKYIIYGHRNDGNEFSH